MVLYRNDSRNDTRRSSYFSQPCQRRDTQRAQGGGSQDMVTPRRLFHPPLARGTAFPRPRVSLFAQHQPPSHPTERVRGIPIAIAIAPARKEKEEGHYTY